MLDAALLGLEIPGFNSGNAASLVEHYARGGDLVAVYCADAPETAARRYASMPCGGQSSRRQATNSWRPSIWWFGGTDLLQSRPAVVVQARTGGERNFSIHSIHPPSSKQVNLSSPAELLLRPSDGPGCVLWRLCESELSYCEMIHPADFHEDEIVWKPLAGGSICLRRRLFPESLEKGVILRARVRGVLLPRQDDLRIAAACYAAFVAAEPPLESY